VNQWPINKGKFLPLEGRNQGPKLAKIKNQPPTLDFYFPFASNFPPLPPPHLSRCLCHQPHAGLSSTTRNTTDRFSPLTTWAFFFFFFLTPLPLDVGHCIQNFACNGQITNPIVIGLGQWPCGPRLDPSIRLGQVQPTKKESVGRPQSAPLNWVWD